MGSGGKSQTVTVRYASYLESAHKAFITKVTEAAGAADASNPYVDFATSSAIDIEDAFFGTGYLISSFPSLYDMFGKFMAGLDIEVLFDQILEDTINGATINNAIGQEAIRLSDDLEQDALPRFETGMRDLNAVMSSSFIVGRAMMEVGRTKALARYDAEARFRMLPLATERWKAHLDWNKETISMYAQLMKFYISAEMDTINLNAELKAKYALWPFTIYEFERAALGTFSGATNSKTDVAGASAAAKAIGGAMTGAASGAMIGASMGAGGGPIGAAIGGLAGLVSGLF
jgi:hypothetical protein